MARLTIVPIERDRGAPHGTAPSFVKHIEHDDAVFESLFDYDFRGLLCPHQHKIFVGRASSTRH
jgi:hypothetical protein